MITVLETQKVKLGQCVKVIINSNPKSERKFTVTQNDNGLINLKAHEIGNDEIDDITINLLPTMFAEGSLNGG